MESPAEVLPPVPAAHWWREFDEYALGLPRRPSKDDLTLAFAARNMGLSPRAAVAALRQEQTR